MFHVDMSKSFLKICIKNANVAVKNQIKEQQIVLLQLPISWRQNNHSTNCVGVQNLLHLIMKNWFPKRMQHTEMWPEMSQPDVDSVIAFAIFHNFINRIFYQSHSNFHVYNKQKLSEIHEASILKYTKNNKCAILKYFQTDSREMNG